MILISKSFETQNTWDSNSQPWKCVLFFLEVSLFFVPHSELSQKIIFLIWLWVKENKASLMILKHNITSVSEQWRFSKPPNFREDGNRICPGIARIFRCVWKSWSVAQSPGTITVKQGSFLEGEISLSSLLWYELSAAWPWLRNNKGTFVRVSYRILRSRFYF